MATTRNANVYNAYDLRRYVDQSNFTKIVNAANAKYNATTSSKAQWRLLGDWEAPSDSKTWSQAEKTTPIMARASLLSTHGLKPMRNPSSWKIYNGSTPKFGHGYTFGEDDMFLLRDVRNSTGADMQDLIYDSLLTNSENILGGIHSKLSQLCLEMASLGEVHQTEVDGVKYDFTFDFDRNNQFMTVTTAWFNTDGTPNSSATPLEDILDAQRTLSYVQGRNVDAWMVNSDTLDKILAHPKVVNQYLAWRSGGAATSSSYTYPVTRVEIAAFMHDRGVWPILPIDFKSVHEEDGKPVADAPAFSPYKMIAFNKTNRLFNIKCTNSIWKDRQAYGGIGTDKLYSFVEDRIAVLSAWYENPIHNEVEFELYAGPVFKNLIDYGNMTIWSNT